MAEPHDTAIDDGRGIRLTTFYNGACPVCRTEIKHYKRLSRARDLGLAWCDVSRDRFIAKRLGLDREAVKRRLHAIDRDGKLLVGVAAFVAIWRELPEYRWAAWLFSRPVIRPVACLVYDHVLAAGLYALNRARERRRRKIGTGHAKG